MHCSGSDFGLDVVGFARIPCPAFRDPASSHTTQSVGTREFELLARDKGFLPYELGDYLDFVDWTGRELIRGNKGRIPNNCKPILERVGLNREVWCELVRNFGRLFGRVAGTPDSLQQSATSGGVAQRRSPGGPELLVG